MNTFRNIFLAENDSIKLGDFGVSRLIESTIDVATYAGSVKYMSPEVKKGDFYSYNTDCWSIGCVLYELTTLSRFHDKEIKTNEGIQKEINDLDTLFEFKELLKCMLQMDRTKRAESDALKSMLAWEKTQM